MHFAEQNEQGAAASSTGPWTEEQELPIHPMHLWMVHLCQKLDTGYVEPTFVELNRDRFHSQRHGQQRGFEAGMVLCLEKRKPVKGNRSRTYIRL